jgi:hypothetical protein
MDKKEGTEITRRCFLKQGVIGIGAVTVGGSVIFPENWPSKAFASKFNDGRDAQPRPLHWLQKV